MTLRVSLLVALLVIPSFAGCDSAAQSTTGNNAGGGATACRPMPLEAGAINALAQRVPTLSVISETAMIPSGQPITLHLAFPSNLAPAGPPPDFAATGRLANTTGADAVVFPILSWKPSSTDPKSGDLILSSMQDKLVGDFEFQRLNLFVAACLDGKVQTGAANALVSVRLPSVILAGAITVLFYVFGALSMSREALRGWRRLNPLYLALDGSGRASLSQMQIIFFSVIVLYLVSYILLRTGILASLSNDVLLLLGIAGIGSIGGQLATNNTQRISFDNWAWIMRKGWTTATGYHVSQPHWNDLFTTRGDFDPYKFQMVSFSFVIGISLLMIGLNGLANFSIPQTLLGVIGLSQAAYIGGKIVAPITFGDLDKKLAELRKAQDDFLAATADKWVPPTAPRSAQLAAAQADNRAKYIQFQALVGPAYTMFAELFTDKGALPNLEPDP